MVLLLRLRGAEIFDEDGGGRGRGGGNVLVNTAVTLFPYLFELDDCKSKGSCVVRLSLLLDLQGLNPGPADVVFCPVPAFSIEFLLEETEDENAVTPAFESCLFAPRELGRCMYALT